MLLELTNYTKIVFFHKELRVDEKENILHCNNWNTSGLLHLIFSLKSTKL